MALLVVLAPLGMAALLMPLIRWPGARLLLQESVGSLKVIILCPVIYLIFSVVVALFIASQVQRMAHVATDTIFWEGDNQRMLLGVNAKYWMLFLATTLPVTLFDAWLVRGKQPPNTRVFKRILGWTCVIVANSMCPLAVVIVGILISEIVYGGY